MAKIRGFKRGLRLGTIRKFLKKGSDNKHFRNMVYSDLKHANDELIDYLLNIRNKDLKGVVKGVQIWLDMHGKMTGFEKLEYLVGDGKNVFRIVEIEKELYNRKKDKNELQ